MHKQIIAIDPWLIKMNHFDRKNRRLIESLTSQGNGYMGFRGNFEESYSGDSLGGTYLAGVWFPDKTKVGWWKNGYPDYFGKVINTTNFMKVTFLINKVQLDLAQLDVTDFSFSLDMRNGLLTRSFIYTDAVCKVQFVFKRFLSIVNPKSYFSQIEVKLLNGEADIILTSILDGAVKNEDSNYGEMFWQEKDKGFVDNKGYLTMQTIANSYDIPQFSVTSMMEHTLDSQVESSQRKTQGSSLVEEEYHLKLKKGKEAFCFTKTVVVLTSRSIKEDEQVDYCQKLLLKLSKKTFAQHFSEQKREWQKRWQKADVSIEGDVAAQQGIRFNLFQLFSTYYSEDEHLNIGPKGFTGEKYGGATYWDTEAFAVPLYLALSEKEVSRKLLLYRYHQLAGAKLNAKKQGLQGALYPMVTFTGVECHNEWEITFEEIHRNGAMVYAIYNYTKYTGDESYLEKEGLEVMVEIARFWADRVHYSQRKQCYMIHGVTGPNEYENNVNNNWYTNTLAKWGLEYTMTALNQFPYRKKELNVSEAEWANWQTIVRQMYLPVDENLGIFVQHDTFLDKDLQKVADLDQKILPLNQNWSWDKILRSCFIKQADVLQGIYLFSDRFSLAEKTRNFAFYEPMTVHESSLSPSVHAVLAAEIGAEKKAVEMYQRTARLDLDNYNQDTEDGLHITSMTGSWLAIVQGFAGMRTHNGLEFTPFLPEKWQSYSFRINYQNRLIEVKVSQKGTEIEIVNGEALEIKINGCAKVIQPAESLEMPH